MSVVCCIVIKAVFHLVNFIARSDFVFCLLSHGLSIVTGEKHIQFMQRNVSSRDKIHLVLWKTACNLVNTSTFSVASFSVTIIICSRTLEYLHY